MTAPLLPRMVLPLQLPDGAVVDLDTLDEADDTERLILIKAVLVRAEAEDADSYESDKYLIIEKIEKIIDIPRSEPDMGSLSLTKRLQEAERKGQELVTTNEGRPVTHEARNEYDSRPWVSQDEYGVRHRHSAAECFARLSLPVPAGAVLEHTQSRKRCLFVGPSPQGYPWLVQVDIDGQVMEISRALLRPVTS